MSDNLIDDLVTPVRGAQNIIEVDADYQALITDDILNCDGDMTITLVPSIIAAKEITVSSTDGEVTLDADVPIEAPSVMTTGTSETFYLSRGQWWHK